MLVSVVLCSALGYTLTLYLCDRFLSEIKHFIKLIMGALWFMSYVDHTDSVTSKTQLIITFFVGPFCCVIYLVKHNQTKNPLLNWFKSKFIWQILLLTKYYSFFIPLTSMEARRLQENSGRKHGKDVICSHVLKTHRSLPQGVEFFWSFELKYLDNYVYEWRLLASSS